jgi:hypothetical protein
MTGKELAQVLNKFLTSPNAQSARVQIEMPNGEKLDVSEIQLLENRMIGDRDTHRINIKGQSLGGTWKMSKIIPNSLFRTSSKKFICPRCRVPGP